MKFKQAKILCFNWGRPGNWWLKQGYWPWENSHFTRSIFESAVDRLLFLQVNQKSHNKCCFDDFLQTQNIFSLIIFWMYTSEIPVKTGYLRRNNHPTSIVIQKALYYPPNAWRYATACGRSIIAKIQNVTYHYPKYLITRRYKKLFFIISHPKHNEK